MRTIHPEAHPDETWIGNLFATDFKLVGWTTKRRGETAYMANGNAIPRNQGFRPVFVTTSELTAAGVQIPDTGTIDHRWIL